jgi:hypothetical protein
MSVFPRKDMGEDAHATSFSNPSISYEGFAKMRGIPARGDVTYFFKTLKFISL